MNWVETDLGYTYTDDKTFIFFGHKKSTLDEIKKYYPHYTFRMVHQIHSDICIPSVENSNKIQADSHFTEEKNVALMVKTADCIPILISDYESSKVLAIHAGWRGVENQISSKSIKVSKITKATVFIGPSIQQKSFEVDVDVKDRLEKIFISKNDLALTNQIFKPDQNKFFVNLEKIVSAEIMTSLQQGEIISLPIDTKSDLRFHSYRRDKEASGRNLSFIVRTGD